MTEYDYKTVAAPRRARKVKGVKGRDAQYALAIEDVIREQAASGWAYQRADIFEVDEPGGLFGKSRVVARSVMIFRRPRKAAAVPRYANTAAQPAPAPVAPAPNPAPVAPASPTAPAAPTPPSAPTPPEPQVAAPTPPPAEPVPNTPGFSIAGVTPPGEGPRRE